MRSTRRTARTCLDGCHVFVAGKGRVSFVRRLTAEQIDQVVALLLSKNEEYLALGGTGRIGAGCGHRDGVFYALAVDDELRGPPAEVSFKSEADLRVSYDGALWPYAGPPCQLRVVSTILSRTGLLSSSETRTAQIRPYSNISQASTTSA